MGKCALKIDRKKVYDKFEGCCAYCGREIDYEDMQVDHIVSKRKGGTDDMDNLFPACRLCNHYKRAGSVENFRDMVSKIPRKLDRDSYIYRVGEAFGFYEPFPVRIKFYFETVQSNENAYDKKEV